MPPVVAFCGPESVRVPAARGAAETCRGAEDFGGALVARIGRVVMDVGGGPDNAGGRGLVRGGGPIPNPRVAPTFMTLRFCVRGRIGRPLPASAIVGSLDGCPGSYSSSLTVLRLRD